MLIKYIVINYLDKNAVSLKLNLFGIVSRFFCEKKFANYVKE